MERDVCHVTIRVKLDVVHGPATRPTHAFKEHQDGVVSNRRVKSVDLDGSSIPHFWFWCHFRCGTFLFLGSFVESVVYTYQLNIYNRL